MPSESFLHTYQTYKEGTKIITTWLVENARHCGADLSFLSPPAPASQGAEAGKSNGAKSKTKAAKITKYEVPLKHFTGLAKAIAASSKPAIKVPRHVVRLFNSVIILRENANTLFTKLSKGKNSEAEQTANAGHHHFISVLKEVLGILQPQEANGGDAPPLENMFEALTVEETGAEDESLEPTASGKASSKVAEAEYELESTDEDVIFAILTFFRDVNDVRKYLARIWMEYRHGRLDLTSAAVTTDTAFTLLRHSSEDVQQSLLGKPDYFTMVQLLIKHLDQLGGGTTAFADFIFIGTAGLVAKYSETLQPKVVSVMKPDHFGVYDPTVDRVKLSLKDQQHEDLIVLMELLPEFTKISRTNLYVPAQDELTTALRRMMDANDINAFPLHGYCAVQILLDIHHTLRQDAVRPFEQLQGAGKRVVDTLDGYFRYSKSRYIANWPKQNDEVFKQISTLAKDWALNDRLGKAYNKPIQGVRPKPFHLLKNHPVLCGLLVFRLNMLLRDGGITLCNAWGSVMYPAHLYNAARQSADLEAKWEDIEYVLSVHSATRIFVGAPPTDPQEYLKRFTLALGASASNFARNRRPGGSNLLVESRRGPRGLKTTTPVRDIFWSRYVEDQSARLSTSNVVAMLTVASKAERVLVPSADLDVFTKQMIVQKQFTTLQLLKAVREGVSGEEVHLLFDYFLLHQRGCKLLRDLQTHLQSDLVKYFGPNYIENESELPYIVGYIFEVVAGSNRIAEDLRLENAGSRILNEASEVLARLAESEDGRRSKMKAKALSDSIVYGYYNGLLGRSSAETT